MGASPLSVKTQLQRHEGALIESSHDARSSPGHDPLISDAKFKRELDIVGNEVYEATYIYHTRWKPAATIVGWWTRWSDRVTARSYAIRSKPSDEWG